MQILWELHKILKFYQGEKSLKIPCIHGLFACKNTSMWKESRKIIHSNSKKAYSVLLFKISTVFI